MKLFVRALAALAVALVMLPAFAHHSFAMFDSNKTTIVEGTVKKFQWANPHSWLYVTVADDKNEPKEWAIEMGAPNGLARQGWTPKTLTPGMKVKVSVHPLVDGNPGGQLLTVTLPDGKQLGAPSANPAE